MERQRKLATAISAFILASSLLLPVSAAPENSSSDNSNANANANANGASASPSHTHLQGQIGAFDALSDETLNRMGFRVSGAEEEVTQVTDVKGGTPAALCGLQKGDQILNAQLDHQALNLTIERDGEMFKAHLVPLSVAKNDAALKAEVPKSDVVRKPFTLKADQTALPDNQLIQAQIPKADYSKPLTGNANQFNLAAQQDIKNLANFDVELVVDRSLSMRRTDCPGGLSRWDWCGMQAFDLANSLGQYVPNGMTIIPFATEYDVFEHANAQSISYMFQNIGLQLGTRLYEPLAERLDNYFNHYKPATKPLLIVVVTDGMPAPRIETEKVRNELIAASQRMSRPNQVTVVFFQIGDKDPVGQQYLIDLDQNLVNEGAKYHFVHTVSFQDLQSLGLGQALARAVKQYASFVPAPGAKPSSAGSRLTNASVLKPALAVAKHRKPAG